MIIVKIEGGLYLTIRQKKKKKKVGVYQYKDLVYDHIVWAEGLFLTQWSKDSEGIRPVLHLNLGLLYITGMRR